MPTGTFCFALRWGINLKLKGHNFCKQHLFSIEYLGYSRVNDDVQIHSNKMYIKIMITGCQVAAGKKDRADYHRRGYVYRL